MSKKQIKPTPRDCITIQISPQLRERLEKGKEYYKTLGLDLPDAEVVRAFMVLGLVSREF